MKLQTSTDYSQFEMLDFNRDVDKIKKLEKLMKREGWIPAYPCHVIKEKGKLKIKAGHHRFTVAVKLGLPIVYVVCEDNASVHELEEATNRWSVQDYLTSFTRLGDSDYDAVREYRARTGISLSACISMLAGECAGSSNQLNKFKHGEYVVKESKNAEIVADLVSIMKSHGAKWGAETPVVQSLSRLVTAGHADISRFKRKLAAHSVMLKKQRTIQDYCDMFEEIYNRGVKGDRVPLVFLTNETLRTRQSNFGKVK